MGSQCLFAARVTPPVIDPDGYRSLGTLRGLIDLHNRDPKVLVLGYVRSCRFHMPVFAACHLLFLNDIGIFVRDMQSRNDTVLKALRPPFNHDVTRPIS